MMKAIMIRSLLILTVLSSASVTYAGEIRCETEISKMNAKEEGYKPLKIVSIFALLSDPEKYHGQRISVAGAFRLYYDRISLYATKKHLEADEFSSMLWVELPQCVKMEDLDEMSEWQDAFVRIDGVFNAKLKNFAAGTLQDVELVKPWHTEAERTK